MKKQTVQFFFIGLMIAFTLSVLALTAVLGLTSGEAVIPVSFITQVFILSVLCSLINLIYNSEKLKFIWQSLLGYVLTMSAIVGCGLVFDWYGYGENHLNRASFVFVSFLVYTLLYLVTWLIIWNVKKTQNRKLNAKLDEYKHRQ